MQFYEGQGVKVSCEIQPGPFPNERLVTFETVSGPTSGFVREDRINFVDEGTGYIFGVVKDVLEETVAVVVEGSYFTTTGLAYLNKDWAKSHVEAAQA